MILGMGILAMGELAIGVLHIVAQTTTTVSDGVGARNNAALPVVIVAVLLLGALALSAPRLARRINARRSPTRGDR
jgi:hypothetical protein